MVNILKKYPVFETLIFLIIFFLNLCLTLLLLFVFAFTLNEELVSCFLLPQGDFIGRMKDFLFIIYPYFIIYFFSIILLFMLNLSLSPYLLKFLKKIQNLKVALGIVVVDIIFFELLLYFLVPCDLLNLLLFIPYLFFITPISTFILAICLDYLFNNKFEYKIFGSVNFGAQLLFAMSWLVAIFAFFEFGIKFVVLFISIVFLCVTTVFIQNKWFNKISRFFRKSIYLVILWFSLLIVAFYFECIEWYLYFAFIILCIYLRVPLFILRRKNQLLRRKL